MGYNRINNSSSSRSNYSSYDPPSSSSRPIAISGGSRARTSSAMDIPGGGRPRPTRYDSDSGSESDVPRRSDRRQTLAPRQEAPRNLRVYHHTTHPDNVPSHSRYGTYAGGIAGGEPGIGDPYGNPSNHEVYVTHPRHHIMDPQGGDVMIASRHEPQPDPNYPMGTAGAFTQSHIRPMRDARRDRLQTASATFPMSPSTAAGAAAMIRDHDGRHLTPQQAAGAMYQGFHDGFPAHAPHPEDQDMYYTSQRGHPQTPPSFSPFYASSTTSTHDPYASTPPSGFTPPRPRFYYPPRD